MNAALITIVMDHMKFYHSLSRYTCTITEAIAH